MKEEVWEKEEEEEEEEMVKMGSMANFHSLLGRLPLLASSSQETFPTLRSRGQWKSSPEST